MFTSVVFFIFICFASCYEDIPLPDFSSWNLTGYVFECNDFTQSCGLFERSAWNAKSCSSSYDFLWFQTYSTGTHLSYEASSDFILGGHRDELKAILSFYLFVNVSSSPNTMNFKVLFNGLEHDLGSYLSYSGYHEFGMKVDVFRYNKFVLKAKSNGSVIPFQSYFCAPTLVLL